VSGVTGQEMDLSYRLAVHYETAPAFTGVEIGLALRFPRFTGRYRDDKAPTDATTVQEVLGL
jgi:ATP-dependent DNA ligase